ncbi:MAG: NUDIX domain-containing protein [bacterium]
MDLTINIKDIILNIRVVVLVKTKKGYVLEKSPNGYLYFIGGRIKINETSEEAAKREIHEEIGIEIDKLIFKTVVENFFISKENKPVHEISFVYTTEGELEIPDLTADCIEYPSDEFEKLDIRPKILKDYILTNNNNPHIIYKGF